MKLLSQKLLSLAGWRVIPELPEEKKYVLICYPHTSNWDMLVGLLSIYAMDLKVHWLAKHTIFIGPVGWLFRKMGGIPVDRTKRGDAFSKRMAALFQEHDEMVVGLMPEGTRSMTDHWRSGFYYMAQSANVPLALALMDYKTKTCGIGKVLIPSGDIDQDMVKIREFYQDVNGKRPELQGTIQLKRTQRT